jgi:hypothetical protein
MVGPETFDGVDAVARTGAAVDEVDDGNLYVTATPAEGAAIRALGFDLEAILRPILPDVTIQSFPGYEE